MVRDQMEKTCNMRMPTGIILWFIGLRVLQVYGG